MYFSITSQYFILLLRIATGWMIMYDGFSKLSSKSWSISPIISGSHIVPEFYNQLATAPVLSLLTQWYPVALIVVGAMILTGLWIRVGGASAILLLLFTYLPQLRLPPAAGSDFYLINTNMLIILVICVLLSLRSDQFWGLGADLRINK